jgi:hypothetical protein
LNLEAGGLFLAIRMHVWVLMDISRGFPAANLR